MTREASQFRRNLIKVLAVQLVALLLLWLLQTVYAPDPAMSEVEQEIGGLEITDSKVLLASTVRTYSPPEVTCIR